MLACFNYEVYYNKFVINNKFMKYIYIWLTFYLFFKRFYLFTFRENGREGGREGEKHQQRVVASHVPPTEDLARNPGMCSDWESNWQPFGSQASTQSTEPHQLGLINFLKN